jgi:hypothetical protein
VYSDFQIPMPRLKAAIFVRALIRRPLMLHMPRSGLTPEIRQQFAG